MFSLHRRYVRALPFSTAALCPSATAKHGAGAALLLLCTAAERAEMRISGRVVVLEKSELCVFE